MMLEYIVCIHQSQVCLKAATKCVNTHGDMLLYVATTVLLSSIHYLFTRQLWMLDKVRYRCRQLH